MFAKVTGKSRDAVVGLLNGLEEEKLETGIKFLVPVLQKQMHLLMLEERQSCRR